MKHLTTLFTTIGLICLMAGCMQPVKEMPITTSSDEALELFIQARDRIQNSESTPGYELLHQAIALDPNFALAHCWLNTPAGIKKAMDLIDQVTPGEAHQIHLWDATIKGDDKLADAYMESLLTLFPEDKYNLFTAGKLKFQRDPRKALEYFNKAIAVDDYYAAAYCLKGYLLIYQGNLVEAEPAFSKYVELLPESGNAHDSYGDLLLEEGKYIEAQQQFRLAAQYEPSFANSLYKVGWKHIRNGAFDLARKSFNDVQETSQTDAEKIGAIAYKALSSFVEENMDQAFADLDEAKKLADESNNKLYSLYADQYKGMMLLESGNPAEAVACFQGGMDRIPSLGLDPTEESRQAMYFHGFLTMAMAFNGQLDDAETEFAASKKLFDTRDNNVGDVNFLSLFEGALEINKGNWEKAIQIIEPRALSGSVSNQYYLGLAYDRSGNVDKAIEFYTKANQSTNPTYTAFYINKTRRRIAELER